MKIDVLTLFPDMFAPMTQSMIGKALDKGTVEFNAVDFRQYSHDKHNHVDDTPYGGGAGMLLKPEPLFEAMDDLNAQTPGPKRVILLDPAGANLTMWQRRNLRKKSIWCLSAAIMKVMTNAFAVWSPMSSP